VDIVSAQRGGELIPDSGTSMACPHVAAVAALWWQRLRGDFASPQTVAAKLVATARTDVFAGKLGPVDRGAGLVFAPQPVK
jgi:subtilisin family serine protease